MAHLVAVGVVDDVDVSRLGQGATFERTVPVLVDVVGIEHLLSAAVEDDYAVVRDAVAGMVENHVEGSDVRVVGVGGKGIGYPQDGVIEGGIV